MNEIEAKPLRDWTRAARAKHKLDVAELDQLNLNKEQRAKLVMQFEWRLAALEEIEDIVSRAIHASV
jgi:hypothetical protein